jgi:hypothetical protein
MSDSEIGQEISCPHCSRAVPSSAVRCKYCLRSLLYDTPKVSTGEVVSSEAKSKEPGTRRIVVASVVVIAVVIAIAVFFVRKVQFVNPIPSIAAGEKYFLELKGGNVDTAYAQYDNEFRVRYGDGWRGFLSGLQQRYGAVTTFTVSESRIVPVSGVGCTLLRYKVARGQLITDEKILFCPTKSGGPTIIGHEVVGPETGQKAAAGQTVVEFGIHLSDAWK